VDDYRQARRDAWDDIWHALLVAVAAGGAIVVLAGLWKRFVTDRRPAQPAALPVGELAAAPPAQLAAAPAPLDSSPFSPRVQTVTVGASVEKILEPNGSGYARRVVISTDQPIRVLNNADVSSTRGFYVAAGDPWAWPDDLGPNEELYAVRAGASNASVSVLARPRASSRMV